MKTSIFIIILVSWCAAFVSACKKLDESSTPLVQKSAENGASSSVSSPTSTAASNIFRMAVDSPQFQQIRVESVRTCKIPGDEVVSPGQIEVNPNRVSRVLLPLGGRIGNVLVKVGDQVKAEQPLLTVESSEADAAVKDYLQAKAGLSDDNADLTRAQRDYDRLLDLFEHNAVAKKEIVSAEAGVAHARAGVEQATALCDQTRRRLELLGLEPDKYAQKITVRAPIGGRILELAVAPGEYRNDTSTSLMTVADLSSVLVSANVPESQIRFIRIGEGVQVELAAYPGQTFTARVKRIADSVDPQTRTIKVQAELPNTNNLFRPEMFAQIRHVRAAISTPAVPNSAIVQRDGQSVAVIEKSPGVFEIREIKLGPRLGDLVSVTDGLAEGERIVIDGAMLLMR